jgi:hypothetical protein
MSFLLRPFGAARDEPEAADMADNIQVRSPAEAGKFYQCLLAYHPATAAMTMVPRYKAVFSALSTCPTGAPIGEPALSNSIQHGQLQL